MTQYFVDLKDLAREKISFEGSFEPGMVDFASDNVRQVGLLDWSASADRAGDRIHCSGRRKSLAVGSTQRHLNLSGERLIGADPSRVRRSESSTADVFVAEP